MVWPWMLTGTPLVKISGYDNDDFNISAQPLRSPGPTLEQPAPLSQLGMRPSIGSRPTIVSIDSSDENEDPVISISLPGGTGTRGRIC